MNINTILIENESAILGKWIDGTLATYSKDTARIFKNQKDRFANPVGYNVKNSLTQIYHYLCGSLEKDQMMSEIEDLLKIRAVQSFTPSEAVGFIFSIKELVWAAWCREKGEKPLEEWLSFEKRIDGVALSVFDFYMLSRNRLHRIQTEEILRGTNTLTDGTKCGTGILKRFKNDGTSKSE